MGLSSGGLSVKYSNIKNAIIIIAYTILDQELVSQSFLLGIVQFVKIKNAYLTLLQWNFLNADEHFQS